MIEQVDYAALRLLPTAVYRQLGYAPATRPIPRVERMIASKMEQVRSIATPSFSYVMKSIDHVGSASATIDGVTFQSEVLAHLLVNSSEAAVFALTVGSQIEERARELTDQGAQFEAFIVDAIGSCLVQRLVRYVQAWFVKMAAERGQAVSRRFCPGYCDWHVSQQKGVFSLLHDQVPGITLTDHWLMLPHKSMSGIIGVGEVARQVRNYVPCRNCQMKDCIGR